jgi:hypothetical protein
MNPTSDTVGRRHIWDSAGEKKPSEALELDGLPTSFAVKRSSAQSLAIRFALYATACLSYFVGRGALWCRTMHTCAEALGSHQTNRLPECFPVTSSQQHGQ